MSMKKIFILGIVLFAFVGFRPPDGMRKLPVANLQFKVQGNGGSVQVDLSGQQSMMSVAPGEGDSVLVDSE